MTSDHTDSPRPARIEVLSENIPQELKNKPNFVVWRWLWKDGENGKPGKWDKPPLDPKTGKPADANNPATWADFQTAYTKYKMHSFDGIGFEFTETEFCGFDFDDCRDPNGKINETALSEIVRLNSYSEVSPSGAGVKTIVKGRLPAGGHHGKEIGVFDKARYFCLTGHLIPNISKEIESRQDEVDSFIRRVYPGDFEDNGQGPKTTSKPGNSLSLSDAELIKKAMGAANGDKFTRLWTGNYSENDYPSPSEAELALCSMLSFWSGMDAARTDSLFRQSGLMRDKWDERHGRATYGQITIEKAIEGTTEIYNPKPSSFDHSENPSQWPSPLADEAFYGLSGEYVKIVEPHTEADPAALKVQFLSAFGNVIGPGAYFRVEADRHNTKINPVLVGRTAKGRKGTSSGHVKSLFGEVDPDWTKNRIMSGLSTGEGLIFQVRDEIKKSEAIREKGRVTEYQEVVIDCGEKDKRLLIIESEFASCLRMTERDGNTLSPTIRQAWDDGHLRILTKNSPVRATGAHISIIGHITRDELRRYLNRTEAGNGFANRFIWLCVRRSKVLPEGGGLQDVDLTSIVLRLKEAVEFGKTAGEIKKDRRAMELWAGVYSTLSEGKPGLLGAVISRAEAQVMRLACVYALLDMSTLIREEHLLAALAVWDYSESSARYIFGDSTGDPTADRILFALKDSTGGLTRTEISNLFGRNVQADRIDAALSFLRNHRRVNMVKVITEGRSVERWEAVSN